MYIIIIMKRHKCVSGLWNVDVQTLIKGDENQNSQNFPNDIRPPKVFGGLTISMLICPGGNRYKVLQLLGFLGSVRSLRVLLVSLGFCRVSRGSIRLLGVPLGSATILQIRDTILGAQSPKTFGLFCFITIICHLKGLATYLLPTYTLSVFCFKRRF